MNQSPRTPGEGDEADPQERATVARPLAELSHSRLRRAVVIEGPDTGREFELEPNKPSRILLGTSEVCDFGLSDPTVSRRHAAFEMAGKRYRLTDLQSTNGTFVDGLSIVEAYVRGGEIVRC